MKITIDQVTEQYEYVIQNRDGSCTLKTRSDEVLLENASWNDCVDKLIETVGNVSVEHATVMNGTYFWRSALCPSTG